MAADAAPPTAQKKGPRNGPDPRGAGNLNRFRERLDGACLGGARRSLRGLGATLRPCRFPFTTAVGSCCPPLVNRKAGRTVGERISGVKACCDVVNRGVAFWKGRVYVGTIDGRLIALDAKTGKELWSAQTLDPKSNGIITGFPRFVKALVIIGNGGAEFGKRGYVTAYHADSGKQAWRFYTVPNPKGEPDGAASDKVMKELAYDTWSKKPKKGDWRESGGGGTVWDAGTAPAESD